MSDSQSSKLLLTAREAAAVLSISERTLWTWRERGLIPFLRFGAAIRYAVVDLQAFIAQQSSKAV
ncbi:MAG: helix-turn-helix domain-containing protein [Planctomycetes bacterium]|nr:helix-turn-helix domain-containing protein [Planctomycetota bacterium]